ncbi:hypothetical protein HK099_006737 [Clydaea vesicula]|uniref:Uncharacterized protein n=1 Tax=Clydaea vesicula TaxID=447962 RepID=A0AAD5U9A8_9FUNG|nr:hypothetical protein HK099_006737 [Clydaea vesicula]
MATIVQRKSISEFSDSSKLNNEKSSKRTSTYYARRRSTLSSSHRPTSINLNFALSLPDSKENPVPVIPFLPIDLSTSKREDLVKLSKKLYNELNMKNKLISDLKVRENWLVAQNSVSNKSLNIDSNKLNLESDQVENIDLKDNENSKLKIYQSLLYFKKEINKSKEIVEKNTNLLRQMELEKKQLQDETQHLKSIVSKIGNADLPSNESLESMLALERHRVEKLEHDIASSNKNILSLQAKIELWVRSSKRNQEARVQAEACQKALEVELSHYKQKKDKSQLVLKDSAESLSSASSSTVFESDNEVVIRNSELEKMLYKKQEDLDAALERIKEFEQTISEVVNTVEQLERENANLSVQFETTEYQKEELKKKLIVAQEGSNKAAKLERQLEEERGSHERAIALLNSEDSFKQLKNLEEKCKLLEEEKNSAVNARELIEQALSDTKHKIYTLERDIKISEAKKEIAEEETSKLSLTVLELEEDVNVLQNSKSQIESLLHENLSKIDSLEENSKRATKLEEALMVAESDLADLKRDNGFLGFEKSRLESEIAELTSRTEILLSEKKSLITEYETIRSQMNTPSQSPSGVLQAQLDSSLKEILKLESKFKLREEEMYALQNDLNLQKETNDKLQTLLTEKQEIINSLEVQLKAEILNCQEKVELLKKSKEEFKEFEFKIEQTKLKIRNELIQEIKIKDENINELTLEVRESNQLVNMFESELSSAKKELSSLQALTTSNNGDIDFDLQKAFQDQSKYLSQLETEVEKLRSQFANSVEDYKNIQSEKSDLSLKMQEKLDDLDILENRVVKLMEQLNVQKKENELLILNNNDLQFKVISLTEKLSNATED